MGSWIKGQSGNRAGRPKGFAGVAKQIMDATRGGAELVEWALGIWRDTGAEMRDRVEAHRWLADRGLGKPLATVDVTATVGADDDEPDLSALSIDELRELHDLEERRATIMTAVRDTDDQSSSVNAIAGAGYPAQNGATP